MARLIKKRTRRKWKPPGTLLSPSSSKKKQTVLHLIEYNSDQFSFNRLSSFSELENIPNNNEKVHWLDIEGLSDPKLIQKVGTKFGIHPLWLEDVLNTDHRSKLEELDDLIFVILKSIHITEEEFSETHFKQISIFLKDNFLITFHENLDNSFHTLIDRIQNKKGKIRDFSADYLFYSIVDYILDNYYEVLEKLGQKVESIEKDLLSNQIDALSSENIFYLKNEFLFLKKAAVPIRESLKQLLRIDNEEIHKKTRSYFKDALDHSIQIVEVADSYRQILTDLLAHHQNVTQYKMNDIVKVLTVFASIFIPLTFIASVYGMNFAHMPGQSHPNGFYLAVGTMLLLFALMLGYFKYKKWF